MGSAAMGGGMGTTSLDGQEVAELMIPANKVGLIIGTTHLHVVSAVLIVYIFHRKGRRDDQGSSGRQFD